MRGKEKAGSWALSRTFTLDQVWFIGDTIFPKSLSKLVQNTWKLQVDHQVSQGMVMTAAWVTERLSLEEAGGSRVWKCPGAQVLCLNWPFHHTSHCFKSTLHLFIPGCLFFKLSWQTTYSCYSNSLSLLPLYFPSFIFKRSAPISVIPLLYFQKSAFSHGVSPYIKAAFQASVTFLDYPLSYLSVN